jgi:DNA invertase Pin-like site-specific DNA recombinase
MGNAKCEGIWNTDYAAILPRPLLSLEEKIDTSSAAGELVFHVFGAIAHFERRLIAERTRDGIAAARTKGKHPGRQPPVAGPGRPERR